MTYGQHKPKVEVKVRNNEGLSNANKMVSEYVSSELAEQMIGEGRAVRPDDTKIPDKYADGSPVESGSRWRR